MIMKYLLKLTDHEEKLKQNMQLTKVHSIIIVIILVQISLITVGFYFQFTFFIKQNEALEKQVISAVEDTLRNLNRRHFVSSEFTQNFGEKSRIRKRNSDFNFLNENNASNSTETNLNHSDESMV